MNGVWHVVGMFLRLVIIEKGKACLMGSEQVKLSSMPTVSVELMKVPSFLSALLLFRQRSLATLAASSSYLGMLKEGPFAGFGFSRLGING